MDIIVMGVSGCGKSTLAKALSNYLKAEFLEGDDFHSSENIAKMSRGEALTDQDRMPWLEHLANLMRDKQQAQQPFVLACSALKREYREKLAGDNEVIFVYLKGSQQAITERLQQRKNHFMSASLITSQFLTLQEPSADEPVITVSIEKTANQIFLDVLKMLREMTQANASNWKSGKARAKG